MLKISKEDSSVMCNMAININVGKGACEHLKQLCDDNNDLGDLFLTETKFEVRNIKEKGNVWKITLVEPESK